MQPTFAELYCSQHGVAPGDFNRVVFRRSLYPHARLFVGLVEAMDGDFFAPDRDLVSAVGALRRGRDFPAEVSEFVHHPANRGFLRRQLRVRISTSQLRALFKAALAAAGADATGAGTERPFEKPPSENGPGDGGAG